MRLETIPRKPKSYHTKKVSHNWHRPLFQIYRWNALIISFPFCINFFIDSTSSIHYMSRYITVNLSMMKRPPFLFVYHLICWLSLFEIQYEHPNPPPPSFQRQHSHGGDAVDLRRGTLRAAGGVVLRTHHRLGVEGRRSHRRHGARASGICKASRVGSGYMPFIGCAVGCANVYIIGNLFGYGKYTCPRVSTLALIF